MSWEEFVRLCIVEGYKNPTRLKDGRLAAIHERIYNTQILVNIDETGYEDAY